MDAATEQPANRWVRRLSVAIFVFVLLIAVYSGAYFCFRTFGRIQVPQYHLYVIDSKEFLDTYSQIVLDRTSARDKFFYQFFQPAIWIDHRFTGVGYKFY